MCIWKRGHEYVRVWQHYRLQAAICKHIRILHSALSGWTPQSTKPQRKSRHGDVALQEIRETDAGTRERCTARQKINIVLFVDVRPWKSLSLPAAPETDCHGVFASLVCLPEIWFCFFLIAVKMDPPPFDTRGRQGSNNLQGGTQLA